MSQGAQSPPGLLRDTQPRKRNQSNFTRIWQLFFLNFTFSFFFLFTPLPRQPLSMYFSTGGSPIVFSLQGEGLEGDFVLATLVDTDALGSSQPNSQLGTPAGTYTPTASPARTDVMYIDPATPAPLTPASAIRPAPDPKVTALSPFSPMPQASRKKRKKEREEEERKTKKEEDEEEEEKGRRRRRRRRRKRNRRGARIQPFFLFFSFLFLFVFLSFFLSFFYSFFFYSFLFFGALPQTNQSTGHMPTVRSCLFRQSSGSFSCLLLFSSSFFSSSSSSF